MSVETLLSLKIVAVVVVFMSVSGSKFIENRKLYIVGEGELKTNFLFIKEDDSFFKNTRRLGR